MMDLAFDHREMYTFCNIKSLEHLKNLKKWQRSQFRPKNNHTCHQEPNPSSETVPVSGEFSVAKFFCLSTAFTVENHSISDRRE